MTRSEYMRLWRARNPEANRRAKLNYSRSEKGKAARRRNELSEAGRRVREAAKARYADRHPEKVRASGVIRVRVWRGKLERCPCEMCGERKSEAHHPDYSKPLEVQHLCRSHHIEAHREAIG